MESIHILSGALDLDGGDNRRNDACDLSVLLCLLDTIAPASVNDFGGH